MYKEAEPGRKKNEQKSNYMNMGGTTREAKRNMHIIDSQKTNILGKYL